MLNVMFLSTYKGCGNEQELMHALPFLERHLLSVKLTKKADIPWVTELPFFMTFAEAEQLCDVRALLYS